MYRITRCLIGLLFLSQLLIAKEKKISAATVGKNTVAFDVCSDNTSLQKLKDSIHKAEALWTQNKQKTSLRLYLDVLEIAKKQKNKKIINEALIKISKVFFLAKNYKKALTYASSVVKDTEVKKDTKQLLKQLIFIGNIHHNLYDSDVLKNTVSLDSMEYFYKKAFDIAQLTNKYDTIACRIHSGLSVASYLKKKYKISKKHILKAIKISRSQHDTLNLIANLNTLAGIQVQFKNFSKALQYYTETLQYVDTYKKELTKNYKGDLLRNLAWTYDQLKDPIAYKYLMEANRITDNLKDLEFDAILNEIEAKHNVDAFKQRAEKRHLLEVAKKKHFQTWSIILGILLVGMALSFWVYAIYTNLKRENAQLEFGKRELLKEREMKQIESETHIKILNASLDGREAERKEIAAILHDNVSAVLSAASLHLEASKNKIKGEKPIEFKMTQALISEASSKIRDLSHQLISAVLLKFGLDHAIHDLCHKYSNSEIKIKCQTENLSRYEQNFEIKINNILEELINNILKHSNAKTAMVEVVEDNQLQLYIKIQDNGDGFDTTKKYASEGIGIQQIAARVKMMKGSFSIHSDINKGTKVTIQVPYIPKTNGTPEMHA
jgi:two-component system NarL family sensor kinase